MSDFKGKLAQELKKDAPFTKDLEERIVSFRPRKKPTLLKPAFTLGGLAIIAMLFVFLFEKTETADPLMVASEVPTNTDAFIKQLQQNEVILPLLDDIEDDQEVIKVDNITLYGKMSWFSYHNLVTETVKKLKIGDYVLVELDGEQAVRQVVALEGDTYKVEDRNVYINDKRLMLPGYSYMKVDEGTDYRLVVNYFHQDIYIQRVEDEVVAKQEILISEISNTSKLVVAIPQERIMAKVVGIQKIEPTFIVTGDDRALYESFKEDKDIQKLIGVDPVTMARMYHTAELEEDAEMLHAFMPSYVKLHQLTVEDVHERFLQTPVHFSKEEHASQIAYSYNGLENGEVYYTGGNQVANIRYKSGNFWDEMHLTVSMYLNSHGFWERKLSN